MSGWENTALSKLLLILLVLQFCFVRRKKESHNAAFKYIPWKPHKNGQHYSDFRALYWEKLHFILTKIAFISPRVGNKRLGPVINFYWAVVIQQKVHNVGGSPRETQGRYVDFLRYLPRDTSVCLDCATFNLGGFSSPDNSFVFGREPIFLVSLEAKFRLMGLKLRPVARHRRRNACRSSHWYHDSLGPGP